MKRIFYRFTYFTTVTFMAALFCLASILASPSISTGEPGTGEVKHEASDVERIEARIEKFHSELKITAEQEEQWSKLAEVMRENDIKMHELIQARKEKGSTLNAVDQLKDYSEIADEHAAGLKRFIPVFEALYNSMSDSQKKNADRIFLNRMFKKSKKK